MEMIVPDIGVLSAKAREAERTAAESEKAANLNFMGSLLGTRDRTRGSGQEHAESGAKPQTTIKTTTSCKVVNRRSGQSETGLVVGAGGWGQGGKLQGGSVSGVGAGTGLAGANRRV